MEIVTRFVNWTRKKLGIDSEMEIFWYVSINKYNQIEIRWFSKLTNNMTIEQITKEIDLNLINQYETKKIW